MAVYILGVFVTLNLVLTFLTLAAAGRVFSAVQELGTSVEALAESVEDLNSQVQSALDCLVSVDAEANAAE